jgi:hypothetical protein
MWTLFCFTEESTFLQATRGPTLQYSPGVGTNHLIKNADLQPMSFGGKNMKSGREKEGKCKRKRKTGERKKENEVRKREKGK